MSTLKVSLPGLLELRHNKESLSELKIPFKRHQQLKNVNIDWRLLAEVDSEIIKNVTSNNAEVSFELDQDKLIRDGFRNLLDVKLREKPENIIVEFSSPNIAKPFHMGEFSAI